MFIHCDCWQVVELLKSYGIDEIHENIGRTGVVAMIRGDQPGPCIGMVPPHLFHLTLSA